MYFLWLRYNDGISYNSSWHTLFIILCSIVRQPRIERVIFMAPPMKPVGRHFHHNYWIISQVEVFFFSKEIWCCMRQVIIPFGPHNVFSNILTLSKTLLKHCQWLLQFHILNEVIEAGLAPNCRCNSILQTNQMPATVYMSLSLEKDLPTKFIG